ncbi:hypothetical protein V8D89_004009 [Ganoderma adspersum]
MLLDSDNHGRGGYIDDEDELGIPPSRRRPRRRFPGLRYEAYPHAFLPNCGQWQAHGVISSFDKLLTPISDKTCKHGGGGNTINAVSSQIYSTFTHRTRESARMHIAQRGLLTATVAGAWATTPKGSTTFRNLYTQSNFSLPHLRLESQVKNVMDTYLRFENVLRIHCDRMRPESLTGPGFYQDVIRPILSAYYNTNVVDNIRSRCLVLHPELFPNIYLWTLYPIVTLLKSFWTFYAQPSLQTRYEDIPGFGPRSAQNSAVQRLSEAPDHYALEMIAVLERLLNFCHTGLAKVLTHSLMSRLWPTRAILEGYFPFFWGGLSFTSRNATRPILNLARWPLDVKTGKPLCASLRSQEFTYGAAHVETYKAHFQIRCLMARTTNDDDMDVSLLSVLCGLVADAFVSDVIELVGVTIDEVKAVLKENPNHPDAKWMRTRCAKYRLWAAADEPLNYGDDHETLDLLCQAVSETMRDSAKSLPKSTIGQCSMRDVVERLYKIGMGATQQSITAPVWIEGSTPYTLRLALAEAHRQLGVDTPQGERDSTIKIALKAAFVAKHIHFFPDRAGDRTHRPTVKTWTQVGLSDVDAGGGTGRALTHEARIAREFYTRAEEEQRADVGAKWSINGVKLGEYGEYMNRECLPTEWTFKNMKEVRGDEFNEMVYKWAQQRFTSEPQHWQCRLAKALAFLHTSALPNVHMPNGKSIAGKPFSARFAKITPRHAARSIELAREMPLESRNAKGFSNRGIYFTIASTIYLGWIDPSSPTNKTIRKSEEGTLPKDWTKKHSAKGFVVPVLIRFGVLEGWGSGVLYSPKKGESFRVRSQEDLQKWEAEISKYFSKGSKGAYRLAEKVLGAPNALRLDDDGQFPGMHKRARSPVEDELRPPPSERAPRASGSRITKDVRSRRRRA